MNIGQIGTLVGIAGALVAAGVGYGVMQHTVEENIVSMTELKNAVDDLADSVDNLEKVHIRLDAEDDAKRNRNSSLCAEGGLPRKWCKSQNFYHPESG